MARGSSRLRHDHLLVLGALSAVAALVSLAPTPPHDLWWHIRIGQLVADHRAIPVTNMFAWSVPDEAPFYYGAWLGDLLLYAVSALGGVELLMLSRNVLAAILLTLVAFESRRRNRSWRLTGVTVGLAGILAFNNITVRPQMWAWVPFGLFLFILGRYSDQRLRARWLLVLPVLMMFWVNIHGSFVLGLAIIGAYLVGEVVRRLLLSAEALDWTGVRTLALATFGVGFATLANPRGGEIITYVAGLLNDLPSQKLIIEWQPPSPSGLTNTLFFVSILLLLTVTALSARPFSPTDLILLCGFLWLAWSGQRYIIWYGIVAMPMLVQGLTKLRESRAQVTRTVPDPVTFLLTGLILTSLVLVQPWFVQDLALPGPYAGRMLARPAPPLVTPDTPVAATEYLRANPGGQLFNELGQGSYLIWALPEQQVFIDPRIELFPLPLWVDYIEISRGRAAIELLARYGVGRVMLNRELQPGLSATLAYAGEWAREYQDQHVEVWRHVPLPAVAVKD